MKQMRLAYRTHLSSRLKIQFWGYVFIRIRRRNIFHFLPTEASLRFVSKWLWANTCELSFLKWIKAFLAWSLRRLQNRTWLRKVLEGVHPSLHSASHPGSLQREVSPCVWRVGGTTPPQRLLAEQGNELTLGVISERPPTLHWTCHFLQDRFVSIIAFYLPVHSLRWWEWVVGRGMQGEKYPFELWYKKQF